MAKHQIDIHALVVRQVNALVHEAALELNADGVAWDYRDLETYFYQMIITNCKTEIEKRSSKDHKRLGIQTPAEFDEGEPARG